MILAHSCQLVPCKIPQEAGQHHPNSMIEGYSSRNRRNFLLSFGHVMFCYSHLPRSAVARCLTIPLRSSRWRSDPGVSGTSWNRQRQTADLDSYSTVVYTFYSKYMQTRIYSVCFLVCYEILKSNQHDTDFTHSDFAFVITFRNITLNVSILDSEFDKPFGKKNCCLIFFSRVSSFFPSPWDSHRRNTYCGSYHLLVWEE